MPDPFGRGYPCPIRSIHRYHAIGRANGTTIVVMFVGLLCWGWRASPYYSYCRNPTGREFFVPAWTLIGLIGVKLLTALLVQAVWPQRFTFTPCAIHTSLWTAWLLHPSWPHCFLCQIQTLPWTACLAHLPRLPCLPIVLLLKLKQYYLLLHRIAGITLTFNFMEHHF